MAILANTLELYRKHLFENPQKEIPKDEFERLVRIRKAFTHWCEFPMQSDVQIRDFLMKEGGIKQSMAYYDLEMLKVLLGNIKNAGKEWHRYRLIQMIEKGYEMAVKAEDAKAIALLADKYGKYTQLDVPDHENLPWEDIIPQPFEPTSDPTALGITPDPDIDKKISDMKSKYLGEIDESITDVDYVEIMKNDNEKES